MPDQDSQAYVPQSRVLSAVAALAIFLLGWILSLLVNNQVHQRDLLAAEGKLAAGNQARIEALDERVDQHDVDIRTLNQILQACRPPGAPGQ